MKNLIRRILTPRFTLREFLMASVTIAVLVAWGVDRYRLTDAAHRSRSEAHGMVQMFGQLKDEDPIMTGGSRNVGYQVFARFDGDLIIFLNARAKETISFDGVTLTDSRGEKVVFHQMASPQTIGPFDRTVLHLVVLSDDYKQPWTLRVGYTLDFDNTSEQLVIEDIKTGELESRQQWWRRNYGGSLD